MESILKIIFLSIILASIDVKISESSLQYSDSKNETLNDMKSGNKSVDLVTSDLHYSYSYAKEGDPPYDGSNYRDGKSYLKEVHYFHDKEVGFERKHDWRSDNNEEIASKKIKKDLYNKGNYAKKYDSDDMIEVKKWDDEDPNIYSYNNDQANHGNYNNFEDNKSKIRLYSNINLKINDKNLRYESDGNKDNSNYSHREYGTQQNPKERGRDYSGYDQNNQKWFTNMEDKVQSGSTDNEVKDEDNYNNFNSPKFIVNFHSFKPWNRIMRSRRHEESSYNTDKSTANLPSNFEIYSNRQSSNGDNSEVDTKFNYEPKLLTNLNIEIHDENKDDSPYNKSDTNESKNKIDSNDTHFRYKAKDFKEMVKKGKSRPKNMRYHYEKRVEPGIYANTRFKTDEYGNGYESDPSAAEYPPIKNEMSRKFIEMPYDMFNTGWSSVRKPLRQRTDRKTTPKVKQYRYGF